MVEKEEGAGDKASLKPAQVVASALAAVTAAFLGSTLGVAGTIAGAGIASVVTTVGGEVYLRSLRKTRAAARRTKDVLSPADTRLRQETRLIEPLPARSPNPLVRRSDGPTVRLPRPTEALPATSPAPGHTPGGHVSGLARGEAPTVRRSAQREFHADARTVFIPKPAARRPGAEPPATTVRPAKPDGPPPEGAETGPRRPWWKNRWTLAVATSIAAFVIGIFAITGFEAVTGRAVSGGSGTTIGRIGGGSPGGDRPDAPAPELTVTETPSSSRPPTATRTTPPMSSTTPTAGPSSSPAPSTAPSTGFSAGSSAPVTPSPSAPPSSR
jgi:hypothetical protein